MDELKTLDESLATIERANRRVIVRFIYDYPTAEYVASGLNQRAARTASASVMSLHISQLAGVIRHHKRAVFAVESGLVGFWGEQHGDAPNKQTPDRIYSIVDQWRTALSGTEIQVLARYPRVLEDHLQRHPDVMREQPRLGFWNDCLGAYDDENMISHKVPIVEGETCALKPRIDYSCSTMSKYFQASSLDLLHSAYFMPTIQLWRKEGCLDEIKRSLGYRYVIRSMRVAVDRSELELRIDNVGWGRSHISRPLYLVRNGRRMQKIADLQNFAPGSTNLVRVFLRVPLPLKSERLELETDDQVRFSNTTGNLL
jgi:hypothetical protein